MLKDRISAGAKISKLLVKYKGKSTVVYAIPRGGVIVGRAVADELGAPLDIVVTRKLVDPKNVTYVFGSIDEQGNQIIDSALAAKLDPKVIQTEIETQKQEVERRAREYRRGKDPISSTDKIAIIVDDGITTGFNIRPAVQFIKSQNPKKIVVAIPVAPRHSLETVRAMVDEIVILIPPETFGVSVDEHYKDFAQPDDASIVEALAGPRKVEKQAPFKADIIIPREGPEPFFSSES